MIPPDAPKTPPRPPRMAEWVFKHLFPDREIFTTIGDLEEIFRSISKERGSRKACLWYWSQLFRAFPHRLIGFFFMDIPLFILSLKILSRNLRKNKVFSFLNIAALTLGLSCFFLIFLFARYEFTYDSFHQDYHHIYKVHLQDSSGNGQPSFSFPLAPVLEAQIPEIEQTAQYCWAFNPIVKIGQNIFESSGKFADENFLELFHFPLRRGIDRPLAEPFSIILTDSAAERFIGGADPIGKTLTFIIRGETCELTVTGLMDDPPQNTHFDFDLLISFSTTEALPKFKELLEAVSYRLIATYIHLHKDTFVPRCEKKIVEFLKPLRSEATPDVGLSCGLQPISDINLRPDNKDSSAIRILYLYLSLGIIILIIAGINYVNLATARSSIRLREIGVRKTIGAQKRQLIKQFIGEAILLAAVSFALSLIVLWCTLPILNRFMNKDISLSLFFNGYLWLDTLGIVFLVGIAAGLYPALFLSSFKPVQILRGPTLTAGTAGFRPTRLRNVLVVMQFTVSVVLISTMLFVHQQVKYIKTCDLGFEKKNIVEAWVPKNSLIIKDRLLQNPQILGVTLASNGISLSGRKESGGEFGDRIKYLSDYGLPIEFSAHQVQCDQSFLDVFSIPLLAGRNFSNKMNDDQSAIVNDTFARQLGPESPLMKRIQIKSWTDENDEGRDLIIIGVVKDFHHQPLTHTIKPLILTHTERNFMLLYAKVRDEDMADAMADVQKTVQESNQGDIPPIHYLDERILDVYKTEENQGALLLAFSMLAILIACLGLFGLAAFTTERKTKEIGIRKVLGARTGHLFLMVFKDLGKLSLVANVIGWPLGLYFVRRWMENFAYHVPILPWIFLLTGLIVFVAMLVTSGTQIVRVSRINPAEIIKFE